MAVMNKKYGIIGWCFSACFWGTSTSFGDGVKESMTWDWSWDREGQRKKAEFPQHKVRDNDA